MPKKRFGAEQIVTLLRLVEMFMARGKSTPEALGLSVSLFTYLPRNYSSTQNLATDESFIIRPSFLLNWL
jgi:hypothetical protein